MSDPFRRVRAGSKLSISAGGWNDVVKQTADRKRQGERPSALVDGAPLIERSEVLVYNPTDGSAQGGSGGERTYAQYEVVDLLDPLFPPVTDDERSLREFDRRKVLVGVRPLISGSTHFRANYAVVLEPGRIGRACFRGVTLAKVVAKNDDKFCTVDIVPASPTFQKLKGGAGSIRLLWKDAGVAESEERLALVCLDGSHRRYVFAHFNSGFYGSGPREAILLDDPGGSIAGGPATVEVLHHMYYANRAYLALLTENNTYKVVEKGEQIVHGIFSSKGATTGTIAVGGVDVQINGSPLGSLIGGKITFAYAFVAGPYVAFAQGCSA